MLISGTVLLNLDSEEDGELHRRLRGRSRHDGPLRRAARARAGTPLRVTVSGALGGHSGGDITLAARTRSSCSGRVLRGVPGLRIARLDGGASRNAIPRDATAVVIAADEADRELLEANGVHARNAYRTTDPGVRVAVEAADAPAEGAWTTGHSRAILDVLAALPAGPLGMSADFPGVVETSSSIGVAETDGDQLTIRSLTRSANDGLMPEALAQIAAAARLAGADYDVGSEYPGWRPDMDSQVLATARTVHARLFGAEPEVTLTHGGLEAAVISAKRPGIDPISFGPEIQGPHAPGERLHIASAQRFMRTLEALVDELSR